MDVYKAKIQSDGSLDKLKLRIVVRGDLQNKEMVGDTWSPTASMRTLKYFLADAAKHKARVHQLDFIGSFLQAKVKNRLFVKLDMRYADYFLEYAQYFGRALKLLKSVYGMTNSGKLFADELTEWLIEEGFMQSQCQISIYYVSILEVRSTDSIALVVDTEPYLLMMTHFLLPKATILTFTVFSLFSLRNRLDSI